MVVHRPLGGAPAHQARPDGTYAIFRASTASQLSPAHSIERSIPESAHQRVGGRLLARSLEFEPCSANLDQSRGMMPGCRAFRCTTPAMIATGPSSSGRSGGAAIDISSWQFPGSARQSSLTFPDKSDVRVARRSCVEATVARGRIRIDRQRSRCDGVHWINSSASFPFILWFRNRSRPPPI